MLFRRLQLAKMGKLIAIFLIIVQNSDNLNSFIFGNLKIVMFLQMSRDFFYNS